MPAEADLRTASIPPALLERARQPAFTLVDRVSIRGRPGHRLMVVLRTNGCAYDADKAGCAMCDFIRHAVDRRLLRVGADHLEVQLATALQAVARPVGVGIGQVDLLTLGSFLHDAEVTPEARGRLLRRLAAEPGVEKIVIESRAPYVTAGRLAEARACLARGQELELGLGVESSDDHLRNDVLHKGLDWQEFRRVLSACAETGTSFMSYLLVKPQTLSEGQAILDAARSAATVAAECRAVGVPYRIALEPVFVTHDTPLERLYLAGQYRCCSLWTVVEVIHRCHGLGTIFVGLSDEGLSDGRLPRNCPACDDAVRASIQRFNATQDLSEFSNLTCPCRDDWVAEIRADGVEPASL